MSAFHARALVLGAVALVSMGLLDDSPPSTQTEPLSPATARAGARPKLPVRFEANAGQLDDRVRFVARQGAATLFLGDDGATLSVHERMTDAKPRAAKREKSGPREEREGREPKNPIAIKLKPAGARDVAPQPSHPLVTKTNYFLGNDPAKWRTDVPNYSTITYPSVLDGVDLVYHSDNGALEYDFVVAPNTNVDSVAMNVEGAESVSLTSTGALAIHTAAGDIVQPPPLVYQRDARGVKHTIASSYRIVAPSVVGFKVSSYNRAEPLVIDPLLAFATYLGGSDYEEVSGVTGDALGNTYVTGVTWSTNFPTASAYDATANGSGDVYVAKLDATGANVIYATYLGGDSFDRATGIALDAARNVYLTGYTDSVGFPMSSPLPLNGIHASATDAFVARIGPDGNTLPYSTFLAGSGADYGASIAVDSTGIYVVGTTYSTDFTAPGTSGGSDSDAFVLKLVPNGSAISYLRYFGGDSSEDGNAVAIDASGNAYVAGTTFSTDFPSLAPLQATCVFGNARGGDAFVAKLNPAGATLYATCLGGMGDDWTSGIASDSDGNAYVVGSTDSTDFPAPNTIYPHGGGYDAFVTKLNATGSAIVYSSFIGGAGREAARAIAVDASRTAWIIGDTGSTTFPLVQPLQPTFGGGGEVAQDAFIARVNAGGTALLFSTFYGGTTEYETGNSIAVVGSSIYAGGTTRSTDLPVLNARFPANAGGGDGFVAKLSVPPLLISPTSATVLVGGGRQFSAAGGAGFGYVFTLQTNASNGSISPTGAYSAGVNGSTVDVVLVTDASGLTATATVQVGANTPALVISPTSTSVTPRGTRGFVGAGGVPPYSFSFASNASGGSLSPSGNYTAGTKGSVTDIVRLTDSAGTNLTATVQVGPAIKITPATPATPPNGSVSFSATGGSNGGYVWSISKNASGGSVVATTGAYTAGSGSSTADTVQVTDSLGNKASVNVSVGGGLALAPADPETTTRGAITFTAVGGSGAFNWTLTAAPSGGTINGSGEYVAGTTGNVIDVVRVTDTVGNTTSTQISVGPSLTISPPSAATLAGGIVAFGAAGGSGSFSFSIPSNASGAVIGADGIYTAGSNSGTDTVRLTDSLGSTADALVAVTLPPNDTTTPPGYGGFDGGVIPGINLGGGGANEDCSCRAVGSANHPSGPLGGLAGVALALGLAARRRRSTTLH